MFCTVLHTNLAITFASKLQTSFRLKFNPRHYDQSIRQPVVVGLPSWQCGIPQWYVMCYYRGYLSHVSTSTQHCCSTTISVRQAATPQYRDNTRTLTLIRAPIATNALLVHPCYSSLDQANIVGKFVWTCGIPLPSCAAPLFAVIWSWNSTFDKRSTICWILFYIFYIEVLTFISKIQRQMQNKTYVVNKPGLGQQILLCKLFPKVSLAYLNLHIIRHILKKLSVCYFWVSYRYCR